MAQAVDDDERTARDWRRLTRLTIKRGTIKRRVRKIEVASIKHAHKFLTRRWTNVRNVGRNAIGWLVLIGLLIGISTLQLMWFQEGYMSEGPQNGGLLAEGDIGRINTINPLYTSTRPEKAAEKLLFSSLLSYDKDNALRSDAAKSWSVSEDGKTYKVILRDDVYWHDGQRLTADDVVFTVQLMQNADTKTQLYNNWAGVKVQKVGTNEVDFITPTVYAPFAQALTFSILPQHLLKNIPAKSLRENSFSRNPIGSGPFKFKRIQVINPATDRVVVHMEANTDYYKGKPHVERFQIHTYNSSETLRKGFVTGEVNAAFGMSSGDMASVLATYSYAVDTNTSLHDGMFALFNNTSGVSSDLSVRQALVMATNQDTLVEDALHGQGLSLEGPLPEQTGAATQATFDIKAAAEKLDAAGWVMQGDVRVKDGKQLTISLVTPDTGDYPVIAKNLTHQWAKVGVKVDTKLVNPDEIIAHYIQPRAYDVLLNEFSVGADQDVYAYWHSSQAKSTGLNFANYKSANADDILTSARSRLDPVLRESKYKTFTDQWVKDAPAIALYQPKANYLVTNTVTTYEDNQSFAEPTVRFRAVELWTAQKAQLYKTP